MPVEKGGSRFGFCPGKATWDYEASELYKLLELTYHTRIMPYPGALLEQPAWWIDLLHWFVVSYRDLQEVRRHRAMWGSGDKKGNKTNAQAAKPSRSPRGRSFRGRKG